MKGAVAVVRVSRVSIFPATRTVPVELLAISAKTTQKVPEEVASEFARAFAIVGFPHIPPLTYTIVPFVSVAPVLFLAVVTSQDAFVTAMGIS